jgi:hypothetical protein
MHVLNKFRVLNRSELGFADREEADMTREELRNASASRHWTVNNGGD